MCPLCHSIIIIICQGSPLPAAGRNRNIVLNIPAFLPYAGLELKYNKIWGKQIVLPLEWFVYFVAAITDIIFSDSQNLIDLLQILHDRLPNSRPRFIPSHLSHLTA